MIVYADILIILNLCVNYFLLLATQKILHLRETVLRLLFSAFLSAVSTLYIFMPQTHFIIEFLYKISICLLTVLCAFGFKNIRYILKNTLVFFTVTCAYAGIMIAVWYLFKPKGMIINNSVIYINISPVVLVAVSVAAYLIFILLYRIFYKSSEFAKKCLITVSAFENTVTLEAIVDTGNSLNDVFGKSEIIITEITVVKKLFGEDFKESEKIKSRYRIIPCGTVSGSSILDGYRCDNAVINYENKNFSLEKPILAVSKVPLNDGYNAIINPKILELAGKVYEY